MNDVRNLPPQTFCDLLLVAALLTLAFITRPFFREADGAQ